MNSGSQPKPSFSPQTPAAQPEDQRCVASSQCSLAYESAREQREEHARWYARFREQAATRTPSDAQELTDADVNRLVHELR